MSYYLTVHIWKSAIFLESEGISEAIEYSTFDDMNLVESDVLIVVDTKYMYSMA